MGGRHAIPVAMHLAKGNPSRKTKAELEARQEAEVKLGIRELDKVKPPVFVKNDTVAFAHWKQHLKEYREAAKQGIEVLTTSDVGVLAMYCKTFAEYEALLELRQRAEDIEVLLKLDNTVNKKMDMLLKMQDRLFLNPLAKVKNVPKREKEKPKNPMESAGFDL